MNVFGFAPIITRVVPADLLGNDVFSGAVVRVWGFAVSNTSAGTATATIRTNATSPTTLWTASMPTNTQITVPIPFIADRGLEVLTSVASALVFTFWHSQVGT
jgi:hypothetical protein